MHKHKHLWHLLTDGKFQRLVSRNVLGWRSDSSRYLHDANLQDKHNRGEKRKKREVVELVLQPTQSIWSTCLPSGQWRRVSELVNWAYMTKWNTNYISCGRTLSCEQTSLRSHCYVGQIVLVCWTVSTANNKVRLGEVWITANFDHFTLTPAVPVEHTSHY